MTRFDIKNMVKIDFKDGDCLKSKCHIKESLEHSTGVMATMEHNHYLSKILLG